MECRMQRLYGQIWCYKRTEHRMFRSYLRHFGYRSTNAPHTACRGSPIGPYGGDRAAGAEPPTRVPLKRRIIYTMRIAPRPRDHARDPRAPVRSCWHVTLGLRAHPGKNPATEAVLYLLTPPYTQSRCASTITVYCRACPHATDTNHAYGLCCMHYVCITFRVPCSGVGATSGPCGVVVWGVASHPSATHVVYFCACA